MNKFGFLSPTECLTLAKFLVAADGSLSSDFSREAAIFAGSTMLDYGDLRIRVSIAVTGNISAALAAESRQVLKPSYRRLRYPVPLLVLRYRNPDAWAVLCGEKGSDRGQWKASSTFCVQGQGHHPLSTWQPP